MTHHKAVAALLAGLLVTFTAPGRAGALASGTFYPAQQGPVTGYSSDYAVTVSGVQPCSDCKFGRTLSVVLLNRSTREERRVSIPSGLQQIDGVRFVSPDVAAIIGKFDGALDEVTLIDAVRSSVVDDFLCYDPSVSPDGRFIAYEKFFTEHEQPLFSQSAVYLVYQTRKSADDNRPKLLGSDGPYAVGFPVYPRENAADRAYKPLLSPASRSIHSRMSHIKWLTATKLTFRDRFKGSISQVTIDIGGGVATPNIASEVLTSANAP